tara:strand:+ start:649 stop:1245 length:597 start_codon:yes stop_codon:yes gene_type:complete
MKFLSLVTGTTNQIVTTAEAKTFLKVDNSADDSLIDRYILMASTYLEQYTNRSFLDSSWQLSLDESDVTGTSIELPRAPLSSVTSVSYFESDGTEQTFSTDNYTVDITQQPGRIFIAQGGSWPTDMRSNKAMLIEFVAGWGAAIADVDSFYKNMVQTAVLTLVGSMYDNRAGDQVEFATIPWTKPAEGLVQSIRVLTL